MHPIDKLYRTYEIVGFGQAEQQVDNICIDIPVTICAANWQRNGECYEFLCVDPISGYGAAGTGYQHNRPSHERETYFAGNCQYPGLFR